MPKIDPYVITKRTVWMQRVQDLVRTGHHFHISGQCPLEKVPVLYEKFDRLYDISIDKMQASRNRKAGRCSSRFLTLLLTNGAVHWILLRTDGELSPAAKEVRETWKDALDVKVSFERFELVRVTKPGQKNPSWTWRFEKQRYEDLRILLMTQIAQRRDQDLKLLISAIWHSPGFHGIRVQIKKLPDLIKAEWQRHRKDSEPLPEIPQHLGYVRKLSDKSLKLSIILKMSKPKDGLE